MPGQCNEQPSGHAAATRLRTKQWPGLLACQSGGDCSSDRNQSRKYASQPLLCRDHTGYLGQYSALLVRIAQWSALCERGNIGLQHPVIFASSSTQCACRGQIDLAHKCVVPVILQLLQLGVHEGYAGAAVLGLKRPIKHSYQQTRLHNIQVWRCTKRYMHVKHLTAHASPKPILPRKSVNHKGRAHVVYIHPGDNCHNSIAVAAAARVLKVASGLACTGWTLP